MGKRIYLIATLVLLAVLLSTLVAACGAQEEGSTISAPLDGKALTEERCTKCHDLTRVEQAKKTTEEWKVNVERMVGKGAQLNAEEQAAVIEYLSEAYK
jgi:uncharacterized lipoprotein YehR (DUF1307 family)